MRNSRDGSFVNWEFGGVVVVVNDDDDDDAEGDVDASMLTRRRFGGRIGKCR